MYIAFQSSRRLEALIVSFSAYKKELECCAGYHFEPPDQQDVGCRGIFGVEDLAVLWGEHILPQG